MTHGNFVHGHGYSSPEYRSWRSMRLRCLRENHRSYAAYGGRGITVCDEWRDSFVAFLRDMGPRPRGATLDRIDNNRGYEPSNCRWADRSTQQRNQRKRPGKASQYIGVARNKICWVARVRFEGKKHYCGTFKLETDAARAHDRFLIEHGIDGPLNFPEELGERRRARTAPEVTSIERARARKESGER